MYDCKQEGKINKLCEFKGGVESDIKTIFGFMKEMKENHLVHIYAELKKLGNRPSWAVVFMLTSLVAIITALITVLLRHLLKY